MAQFSPLSLLSPLSPLSPFLSSMSRKVQYLLPSPLPPSNNRKSAGLSTSLWSTLQYAYFCYIIIYYARMFSYDYVPVNFLVSCWCIHSLWPQNEGALCITMRDLLLRFKVCRAGTPLRTSRNDILPSFIPPPLPPSLPHSH